MAKKNHTVEQIIGKLREAEVRLSQGETVGQVRVGPRNFQVSKKQRLRKNFASLGEVRRGCRLLRMKLKVTSVLIVSVKKYSDQLDHA